jgi:hypothetical protein
MTPYRPLKSNPTAASVLAFNTFAATHLLHETACSRVRIGTDLLETSLRSPSAILTIRIFIAWSTQRLCRCAMVWT